MRLRTNSYVAKKSNLIKPKNFSKKSQYSKAISVTGSLGPKTSGGQNNKLSVSSVTEEDPFGHRSCKFKQMQYCSIFCSNYNFSTCDHLTKLD